MDYYLDIHMPMSIERLSEHPGFKGVSVERGIGGGVPGSEPAYVAMCHYLFDTMEDFLSAFSPHAALLQGDIPNYTNVESIIQVSSVEIAQSRVDAPIGSYG
jgi:uncharacterized protein (TIGR02118 family)